MGASAERGFFSSIKSALLQFLRTSGAGRRALRLALLDWMDLAGILIWRAVSKHDRRRPSACAVSNPPENRGKTCRAGGAIFQTSQLLFEWLHVGLCALAQAWFLVGRLLVLWFCYTCF